MSEAIFALVPVRSLGDGKTRLAPEFSEAQRAILIRRMLANVIEAALVTPLLAEVAVISPDPAALAFVSALDQRVVPMLQDTSRPGLNPAVSLGRDRALATGATGLLVLFGDLPLIEVAAVEQVIAAETAVVLAPDRHRAGTNASLVRFGNGGERFIYQYGAGSLHRHRAEATRLGLGWSEVWLPSLANDLDTADDWSAIQDRLGIAAGSGESWRRDLPAGDGIQKRRGA